MKVLLRIALPLLFAFNAKAQYTTVTNLSGTVLYGTTNVTVVPGGTALSTPWCGVSPYWIGSGGPGSYTFNFSPAVKAVRVYVTAMDVGYGTLDTEKVSIFINGVFYFLTSANITTYSGTCGQPTEPTVGGQLVTWYDLGSGGGGQIDISECGIYSCQVWTNGVLNGNCQTFQFSTTGGCFTAVADTPCVGAPLLLYSIGDSTAATYSWTGPGGFTSTLQNPVLPGATMADTGTYRVIGTVGTRHDTAYVHALVKPAPVLIVSSNSPICQGVSNTLNLFATPDSLGETFSWTGPNLFSSTLQNPSFTGFVAADTGYYKVVATWNGCKDSATTHVILAPVPPAPLISGITTYCTGQAFVPFTVTGTGTILWYTSGTGGTGSPTAPTVNTTFGGSYTFWASQTILGCESGRDSIKVTVHVTPAPPPITGTTVYCQYFPYVPPAAAGTNILWYAAATGGVGSTTVPTINTSVPGVYTIYATQSDSGCESPRAPFTITVNPKPAPPAVTDSPANYCPGQAFVPFTVVSGTNILWYTAATGGTGSPVPPSVNTSIPGVHTVWASQTVLGCESDRSQASVTVYDSLTAGFNFTVKYGCKADTVVFTNTSYQATNYRWVFGDGYTSIVKNPIHIYTWQQIDTIRLYSSTAHCIDSSIQHVNLIHPIHAQFTADTNLICQGSAITFTDASVGTSLSYLWNFGDGLTSTAVSPVHNYPQAGVYKVFETLTDFVPCHDTAYTVISVDSISPIRMSITDTAICRDTYVTFLGNYSAIGNTGIVWNMGNGDSVKGMNPLVYAYESTGTYTINAKALYRVCPEPDVSRTVTVIPAPVINLGADTSICNGGEAIIISDKANAGNHAASWVWSNGATTAGIAVTEPGVYSATVKIDGCTASGSVKVTNDCYLDIPNVFTPNGDGMNDYFFPRQLLAAGLTAFSMNIYNRWGVLIFATTSLQGAGWDGRYNGVSQPSGVYVYVIDATFKDGQKEHHQGNVTLLR